MIDRKDYSLVESLGEKSWRQFFRGDAAIFGGLSYRFARAPLTLIAEYESDQYDREVGLGTLEEPDAWNIGLSWQPWSGLKLRGSWLRGDTLGLTFSSQVGTKSIPPRREAKRTVPQNVNAETGLPDGYDPKLLVRPYVVHNRAVGTLLKGRSTARQ